MIFPNLFILSVLFLQVFGQSFTNPTTINQQLDRWVNQYSLQLYKGYLPGVTTLGNNQITYVKISNNVMQNTNVSSQLIIGNFDGNDVLSTELIYLFSKTIQFYLTDKVVENTFTQNQVNLIFAPNPDTLALYWNGSTTISKNLNNVYLDSNFVSGWNESCSGSSNPNAPNYKGPYPSSEIEVTAIRNFIQSNSFSTVLHIKKPSSGNSGITLKYPVGCPEDPINTILTNRFLSLGQTLKSLVSFPINIQPSYRSGDLIEDSYRNFGALSYELEVGDSTGQNSSLISTMSPLVNQFIFNFLSLNDSMATIVNEGGLPQTSKVDVFDINSNYLNTLYSNENNFGIINFWLPDGNYSLTITKPGYDNGYFQISLPFSSPNQITISVTKNVYIIMILYPIALAIFLVNMSFLFFYQISLKLMGIHDIRTHH